MKKTITTIVAGACLWAGNAYAQCPDNNTLYQALNPIQGQTVTNTCVFEGEYMTATVIAGETYVFSLCDNGGLFGSPDTELTLYNNTGGAALAYDDDGCGLVGGPSIIVWTATFTGVVRVLVDEFPCAADSECIELDITWLSAGASCPDMQPICTSVGLGFPATASGMDAVLVYPGNDYDCLVEAPDPTFYYLEIATSGAINMSLTAPLDIDFIIWGPFADLTAAQSACGNLGNGGAGGNVIDCSFSTTASELPSIPAAVVGQVYVMMITNYANVQQNVSLTQVSGTGSTDCSIVCNPDAGTVTTTLNGAATTSPVNLCANGCVTIATNNDFTLPSPAPGEVSELLYAIYTCPPTTGDPATDPCFSGFYWTGSTFTDCNNGTSQLLGLGLGSRFWLAPITADDGDDVNPATLGHDNNGDGCFDQGAAVEVNYLSNITVATVQACAPNTVTMTLSGGLPALVPGALYSATDVGAGNMVQSGAQGQTLTFTNLFNGNVVSVDVTAGGCTFNFQFTLNCGSCLADPGQW